MTLHTFVNSHIYSHCPQTGCVPKQDGVVFSPFTRQLNHFLMGIFSFGNIALEKEFFKGIRICLQLLIQININIFSGR